jgi:hypothetical protein
VFEGIDLEVNRLRAAHPRFRADAAGPIGQRWNSAKILNYVLFADESDRNGAACGDFDYGSKMLFEHEYAPSVMKHSAMTESCICGF